jgi:hypothetical protein
LTFDGWTGPYFKAIGNMSGVGFVITGAAQVRSDEGGTTAVLLENGAECRLYGGSNLPTSTFKGIAGDVTLDGNDITWAEVIADPDQAMMSNLGSTVAEEA